MLDVRGAGMTITNSVFTNTTLTRHTPNGYIVNSGNQYLVVDIKTGTKTIYDMKTGTSWKI